MNINDVFTLRCMGKNYY